MKNLRKILALTMVAVMMLGVMAVSASADEPVTIKWIAQGVGEGQWEELTVPILEAFEAKTGIHVDAEFYAFDDLFEVIETKCASGNADFDVMSVDVTYVSKYGSSGYLDSLDTYYTDEEKALFDNASYVAGVWDGTTYATPMNTSTQILWYNKDLLAEAGVEIRENGPDNRLTYEEVAEMAKKALDVVDPDGTKGIIGFDFQQVSRLYQMNALPNSLGGANISEDGYSLDGVINTPEWKEALTWYQNLVSDGIASRGYAADETGDQFYAGKGVFFIGGTWSEQYLINNGINYGYTYCPCFAGHEDQCATPTGSWYFGLCSSSEKKDAAAEFIKYFTIGEGSDMWYEINGDVPSRLALQDMIVNSEDANPVQKIAAYEAAHTAYARAVTPVFGEYSDVVNQVWEDVRNGADVEETVNYAVEEFAAAVASYKK